MIITAYTLSTGRIINTFTSAMFVEPTFSDSNSADIGFITNFSGDSTIERIVNGKVVVRPEMPVVVEGCNLTEIPVGSTISISDEAGISIVDSELKLSFEYPGTYTVKLECWPYLDKGITIEITS